MGALDKLKDTDEVADTLGYQGRWLEGSSRDLFVGMLHQDTPTDLPGSDSRQDLRDARADEVLHGERHDGRDAALRDFKLDPVSDASARKIGRDLAESVPVSAWRDGDFLTRRSICDEAHSLFAPEMAPDSSPPYHEILPASSLGYTDQFNNVHYNSEMLTDETPQRAIETLAHEYRHVWQRDVMSGAAAHPDGIEGKLKLEAADEEYDADLPPAGAYEANLLEVDSEKFARLLYSEYIRNSKDDDE